MEADADEMREASEQLAIPSRPHRRIPVRRIRDATDGSPTLRPGPAAQPAVTPTATLTPVPPAGPRPSQFRPGKKVSCMMELPTLDVILSPRDDSDSESEAGSAESETPRLQQIVGHGSAQMRRPEACHDGSRFLRQFGAARGPQFNGHRLLHGL